METDDHTLEIKEYSYESLVDKESFNNQQHAKNSIDSPLEEKELSGVKPIQKSNNLINELARIKETVQSFKEDKDDPVIPVGLFDDLTKEDHDTAIKLAEEKLIQMDAYNQEKNLERDPFANPKQKYMVVSWVGPTFKAKTETYGFRLLGVFEKLTNAQKYAQNLHRVEPKYDIGIMEMNLWCLGYPDSSDLIVDANGQVDTKASEENRDRILNDFIIRHKTELEKNKQLFEIRKRAIRKSTITKEEGNPLIESFPVGPITDEMEKMHLENAKQWVDPSLNPDAIDTDFDFDFSSSDKLDLDFNYKVPNQEYAIVSFIEATGNNKRIPVCIRGVFASIEEAESRIKKLIQFDDTYDLSPVPLYKWLPCDPNLKLAKQVYKEKKLNDLLEVDNLQKEESLAFHHIKKHQKTQETTDNTNVFELNENNEKTANESMFSQTNIGDMSAEHILENLENDLIATHSFNPLLSTKDITEPLFSSHDKMIKEFEEKIKKIVAEEGITEEEARERERLPLIPPKQATTVVNEEDLVPIAKIKTGVQTIGSLINKDLDTIEELKAAGLSPAEIRKIISERNEKKD